MQYQKGIWSTKQGIKIMRCPRSGKITKGKYNALPLTHPRNV